MRTHWPLASVPLNVRFVVPTLEDSPAPGWNGGPGEEGRSTREENPQLNAFLCWEPGEQESNADTARGRPKAANAGPRGSHAFRGKAKPAKQSASVVVGDVMPCYLLYLLLANR